MRKLLKGSTKKKVAQKEEALAAPPPADTADQATADGGESAAAPRLGAGTLSCCPLTRAEYEQSWDHLSSKGMPEQSSRLHTTLRLVFGNKVACQHFIRFLKTRGAEATQYFAFVLSVNQLNSKQSPPEDSGAFAKGLYDKFIDPESPKAVPFDDSICADLKRAVTKAKGGALPPGSFAKAKQAALHILQNTHFPRYLQSQQYYKYCIAVLTSGAVTLEDVLYNETAMVGLMDYMAQENASSLLQFWLIVTNLKEQISECDAKGKPVLSDEAAHKDAQALFNRFFAPNGPESLGVDDFTSRETHHNVSAAGRPHIGAFMRAQHLIYTALRQHFFPQYLSSSFYYQYLNGLVMAAESKQGEGDTKDDADEAEAEAGDAQEGAKEQKALRRNTSLGSIDNWGVLHRDDDASNPLFDTHAKAGMSKRLAGGMASAVGLKKKKRDSKADQAMALQVTRMIINDVYKEMKEHHNTDDVDERPRKEVLMRGLLSTSPPS